MNRLLSLVFLTIVLCAPAVATSTVKSEYRKLPPDSLAHMQKQRQFVADLVSQHFSSERITRSRADFALLQKIVDSNILKKDDTWKLQSLGIVFGDALAATIDGLAWWEVTDEYGTDPTLRYRSTTLQLNALTMISKRVEEGREIHLEEMAARLADYIRTNSHEYEN